jgi:heat shock protein HtpX
VINIDIFVLLNILLSDNKTKEKGRHYKKGKLTTMKRERMNKERWEKQNWINTIQSTVLVFSMTSLLALTGWLLGGLLLAIAAVSLSGLLYMFYPLISPYVIVRMSSLRSLGYHEAPRLYQILETLSKRAGLERIPTLFYLPSDSLGAFTTGSKNNAIVTVSDGLLRHLDLRQIAAVMAHEISHIRYGDTHIMGFADMTGRLTSILSTFGQILLIINLPIVLFGGHTISWMAILLLIAAPTINVLLQLALSRTREYRADLGAAELMGDPEPLASALSKIERYQSGIVRRILWPGRMPAPEKSLLRTHPPTSERIRRLHNMGGHRIYKKNRNIVHSQPVNAFKEKFFPPYSMIPRTWRYYGIN